MSIAQQPPITSAPPITPEPAPSATTSQRTGARVAGVGYIAIFVFAIFANFLAVGSVLDPADAGATAESLAASHGTVRIGAIAFLVIFVLDIAVAWALHVLFRRVHADLSLLAAWFRLGYSVMLGTALVFLFAALALVSDPTLAGSGSDAQVLLALQAFDFTWVAGLAAFGIHLVLLGRLLLLTHGAPKALAYVLMVAGTAYAVDTVAHLAIADYEAWSSAFLVVVAIPSVIGEAWLAVWLLRVATGRRAVPVRGAAR